MKEPARLLPQRCQSAKVRYWQARSRAPRTSGRMRVFVCRRRPAPGAAHVRPQGEVLGESAVRSGPRRSSRGYVPEVNVGQQCAGVRSSGRTVERSQPVVPQLQFEPACFSEGYGSSESQSALSIRAQRLREPNAPASRAAHRTELRLAQVMQQTCSSVADRRQPFRAITRLRETLALPGQKDGSHSEQQM